MALSGILAETIVGGSRLERKLRWTTLKVRLPLLRVFVATSRFVIRQGDLSPQLAGSQSLAKKVKQPNILFPYSTPRIQFLSFAFFSLIRRPLQLAAIADIKPDHRRLPSGIQILRLPFRRANRRGVLCPRSMFVGTRVGHILRMRAHPLDSNAELRMESVYHTPDS